MQLEKFIETYSAFYKSMSLVMSDRLSALLKMNMDMKDVSCTVETYGAFCEKIPSFAFIGLYKFKSRGYLVFLDPRMVYTLTNRFLGGPGILEKKPSPLFTMSEELFGNELLSIITAPITEKGMDVAFLRNESKINQIHYFFPDESVTSVSLSCKLNENPVGTIWICHPTSYADEEDVA